MQIITERFHFIDLRAKGSLMTAEKHVFISTFANWHPNAEVVVWTFDKIEAEQHDVPKRFYAETDVRAKADVLRYWILANFGGVYVDTDVICLANWDAWAAPVECFVAQFQEARVGVTNSILGALPTATLFKDLAALLPGLAFAYPEAPFIARTGSQIIYKMLDAGGYGPESLHPVTLPWPELFCPYKMSQASSNMTPNLGELSASGALAVHLWASSFKYDMFPVIAERLMSVLGYPSLRFGEPLEALPPQEKAS